MPSFISSFKFQVALRRARTLAAFGIPLLLAVEAATRIEQAIRYGAPLLGTYNYESALFTRDEFGVKGKPYGKYEKWSMNSLGFRGPEISERKPPGTLRLVSVGASETFGLFEAPDNEWPRQLERRLRENVPNVEVLNASLAGIGLRQRIRFFHRHVLPLGPDLAIFMLDYPTYVGVVRSQEQSRAQAREVVENAPRTGGVIDLRPRLIRKTRDAVLPRLPGPVRQFVQDMIIARLRAFRIRSRMGDDLGRYKEVSEAELKAFEEDLIDILNQAVDEDIGIILLLPAMWVNDATLRDFGTNFPFLHSEWIREARDVFPPVVRRLTADYGVPWVDLAAVVQGRESELMMDMFHFNDLGAQVIAEAVSNEVENWLGVRE